MKSIIGITGCSASGKSTLCTNLCLTNYFEAVVSCTTRGIRSGEVNGISYYFVSEEEFDLLAANMVERISIYGHQYGAHFSELDRIWSADRIPILILDPDGLRQTAEYCDKHKIRLVSMYMENELNVLTERYLSRLTSGVNHDLKYHAARINAIAQEKDTWSKEYDRIRSLYSLRGGKIGNYSEITQDFVHQKVMENFPEFLSGAEQEPLLHNEFSYYQLQQEIVSWANQVFPSSNRHTVTMKLITEELPELILALAQENNHKIKDEMADVMILFMDLSCRLGIDVLAEVAKKMEINKKREWTISSYGVSNHVEK